MSTFATEVIDRHTGIKSWAIAVDDYFGRHHYGIAIPPPHLYPVKTQEEVLKQLRVTNVPSCFDDYCVYDIDEFTEKSRYAFVTDKD